MFIVGGIVGVVVIGVAAHDDHSDYSDHSNWHDHSQYGDSYLRNQIQGKEQEIAQKRRELDNLKKSVRTQVQECVQTLEQEEGMSGFGQEITNNDYYINHQEELKRRVKDKLAEKLEADIKEDKQKLAEIDQAITRINKIQLQKK